MKQFLVTIYLTHLVTYNIINLGTYSVTVFVTLYVPKLTLKLALYQLFNPKNILRFLDIFLGVKRKNL